MYTVDQKPSDQDPHCYKLFAYNSFGAGSRVQLSIKKERSVTHVGDSIKMHPKCDIGGQIS